MPSTDIDLRHGYTLADLHAVARLAVHTAGPMASDWHDRYDTAWSAIAEALYAADRAPLRHDLVHAGRVAIYRVVSDERHHHGFYRAKTDGSQHGPGSSPAFVTYWSRTSFPSPETRVVERVSLGQILPTLTGRQREAIAALAAHDEYGTAADSMGVKYSTFNSYISDARNRFLRLWHEGEKPPRTWGCDRRAGATRDTRRSTSPMSAVRRRGRS
jgi:DNA-directed RNA polymerase specialized sigma24 family protein